MARRILPALAGLLAISAFAIGCGDSNDSKTSGSTTTVHERHAHGTPVADKATQTGASTLRAGLTALLQEHVYLAGIAVDAGVSDGLDSKAFKAAAGELDKNSVALSDAIGSVYNDAAGKQFLSLWRRHIGFFVDYTKARATKNEAGQRAAKADLDGYRAEFGAFLASANPNLTKEAVAEELKPHVASLFTTIDAVVAKSPTVFDKLQAAAAHMPMTADVLAGAIVKQFPKKFDGAVDGGASTLRSALTAQLQEHVYLAGIAVKTGVGSGLDSAAFKAAAGTLDANSVALSKAIGSVYGDAAGKQFLSLWRRHIAFFVDYTKARAGDDAAGQKAATDKLDGYRTEFGAFIASANPNLTKEAVADELTGHVNTLLAAIDEAVAKSPDVYERLRAAAAHMPMTADVLAGAIAKQFTKKFAA